MNNKKSIFLPAMLLLLFSASVSNAASPIYFDGPKVTNKHMSLPGTPPILLPENFTNIEFAGIPNRMDFAVPIFNVKSYDSAAFTFAVNIMGLDNKDNWLAAINEYFNQTYTASLLNGAFQTASLQAGGGPKKDIVIVNKEALQICYEYVGSLCASLSAPMTISAPGASSTDPKINLWRVEVGDVDGDGFDDIVGIGYDQSENHRGYVFYIDINNDATPVVRIVYQIDRTFPMSLALGKYDAGATLDLAIGVMPWGDDAPKSYIMFSKNTGAGDFISAPVKASADMDDCGKPTGLTSGLNTYDPDANLLRDLVLTCYTMPTGLGGGSVNSFKNTGLDFPNMRFERQQKISQYKAPYESALYDFNSDGKADVATADNAGQAIVVIPGGGNPNPFFFDETVTNTISTAPYTPKFIQAHQVDADPASADLMDLVSTASRVSFPIAKRIEYLSPISIVKSDSIEIATMTTGASESVYAGTYSDLIAHLEYVNPPQKTMKTVTPNSYSFVQNPSVDYSFSKFYVTNGISDHDIKSDSSAVSIASIDVKRTIPHAVLVLLNLRPKMTPKQACDSVTIFITPSPAKTIDTATCTSAEAWFASANPQVTPNGSGKDVKLTLPQNIAGPLHFSCTATENPGAATYTTDFTLPVTACPSTSGGACPLQALHQTVWVDDPWSLCVPQQGAGSAQGVSPGVSPASFSYTWTQTSPGDSIFSPMSNLMAQSTSSVGNCMSGQFKWPDDDKEQNVSGTYSIKNTLTNAIVADGCLWSLTMKPANLEGSGEPRCSISYGQVSNVQILSMLSLFSATLIGIYFFRKKQKVN